MQLTNKATILDIATKAQVSTATVDRVLNARPGVHPRTQSHVLDVAASLGYIAAGEEEKVSFDFVLPGAENVFMNALASALQSEAIVMGGIDVRLHLLPDYAPEQLISKLHEIRRDSSGIGVIALDQLLVREALLETLHFGVPLITIASDVSSVPHQGYVGADNRRGGRLAGQIIGRFLTNGKKRVALFAGSLAYRGHEEREMGFRHIMAEEFPEIELLTAREVQEDDRTAEKALREMVASGMQFDGIYSIGSGTLGIGRALEDLGIAKEVVFVAHELHAPSRQLLVSGTLDAVLDQNISILAKSSLERLNIATHRGMLPPVLPLDYRIVLKENIPLR